MKDGTIHTKKKKVLEVLNHAGSQFSSDDVKKLCSSVPGANADFRSRFQNTQLTAIKLPRSAIKQEFLVKMDTCKCSDDM